MKLLFLLPGVIFLFSGLPQTIKLIKTKRSGDIAVSTYGLTVLAISIILLDAIISKNWSITFSNGVSFVLTGINLCLIIKYK